MVGGLLYAVSDELHQLFVPGREATLLDLGFDALGILILLLLVRGREAIAKE
jgi:VanZ family protein